ncbi:MAG TPA: ABC transporter permease [Actinomycetota bacterium]|nr:ABC transporter permease [Actinomycetota bacterium]
MRNQIASEFRKLATTRSIYAMLAGLVVIVGIGVVATTTDGEPGSLLAPLEHQVFFNVSLTIAPLFGLLLGLRSFTDEFRSGSIVPTLLASPVRRRVLGAKLVATAGGGIALSLAAVAISVAVGVPILIVKGIEVTWSTGALALVVGRLVAASVLWTAIGVGLGLAVKHQVAAIAGTLVWILAAEGILSGLVPNVAKYFPGAAGFAVVGINPADVLTPALGALLLGAYAAASVTAGAILMQRRDIT